jgi:AraC family transcriptional regulator
MAGHLGMVLDESNVKRAAGHDYTGAVVEHLRVGGASVARIMHPPGQHIDAHEHDWPVLTLYRFGCYRERGDNNATILFDGPSVVFQPAGSAHADEIGESGLETLAMTFDPSWLTPEARAALPTRTRWAPGGRVAAAARGLADVWLSPEVQEAKLRVRTSAFMTAAFLREEKRPSAPAWAEALITTLEEAPRPTSTLARSLARTPAWVARAYRAWRGEGIAETLRRRRVERATLRLREGLSPLADVAAEFGFCDQSHMNRCFQAVLGRTPLEVRREAALLAPLISAAAG